jgi:hypothetical protein
MTIDIEQCLKNEIYREQTILSLLNETNLDSLSKDQIRKRTYQEYDRLNHLLEIELT